MVNLGESTKPTKEIELISNSIRLFGDREYLPGLKMKHQLFVGNFKIFFIVSIIQFPR